MTYANGSASSAKVAILSCVSGGPIDRLAQALEEVGTNARVLSELSDEAWRKLMGGGRAGRGRARLRASILFPLRALFEVRALPVDAVLVATTNPFFLPWAVILGRPLHRRRVVALVYDLWPDALEVAGIARPSGALAWWSGAMNRWWLAKADGVVFIGAKMAAHTVSRYGKPRRQTVIETGAKVSEFLLPDVEDARPTSDLERWCAGRVVASYVGNMGAMHEWETLAESVPRALAVPEASNLVVVIAAFGPGVECLRRCWQNIEGLRVRFVGPLEEHAWRRLLVRTDLALVTLRAEAKRTSIPSKTFSAMAAGAAIIAVAPADSDLGVLVDRHECGVRVEPGSARELTATLVGLTMDGAARKEFQKRGRDAVAEHYDLQQLARRWSSFISEEVIADRTVTRE